ncbi:hypothetical protein P8S55_05570 [Halomonas sp. M1]|uniref:hypothetical protein n=1 Tax=Halomonas sp. M1 TaxID=3035470 RepID=UPI0024864229|nr:hypothetical protein [Halomonas sp. M1]WFE72562.1 hypothetical protein P8S55_05570 [Halomonas sp. M1]
MLKLKKQKSPLIAQRAFSIFCGGEGVRFATNKNNNLNNKIKPYQHPTQHK